MYYIIKYKQNCQSPMYGGSVYVGAGFVVYERKYKYWFNSFFAPVFKTLEEAQKYVLEEIRRNKIEEIEIHEQKNFKTIYINSNYVEVINE